MALSQKIAYLRERSGMSQRELGDKIGVSQVAVNNWENNKSKPTLDNVFRLATVFDVTVSELFSP